MAERDAAVENLETFIGVLTDTIEKVSAVQPGLEEQAQALEALHGEAEQELSGLDGQLDTALAEASSLADEAKAELEALEGTAREGTQGALSQAESAFDEWKDTLGETLDEAAEAVADAARDLVSDGFEEAVSALREAAGAVQAARASTEEGFEALLARLKEEGDRFTGSLVTASLKAEEAAQAADVLESQFEGRANWITDDVNSASGAAAAVHAETGGNAASFYDGIESRAQSEAQEHVGETAEAFAQAARSLREGAEAPLEEPVDTLVSDALDPFAEEVSHWQEQRDAAEQSLSTWDRHLEDLAATLAVVEQIDELNRALE